MTGERFTFAESADPPWKPGVVDRHTFQDHVLNIIEPHCTPLPPLATPA